MSLGGILGGIAGGIIGFFVGGPIGAAYGFAVGFGVGSYIDPMTPDIEAPGGPKQDLQLTANTIGSPIIDLAGTGKISKTTLLCYGKEHTEAVSTEVEGGKGGGGSQKQQTGNNYYMTWALGICRGPVDTFWTIFKDEKPIWSGQLDRPASGGVQTLAITDFGTVRIYFGTSDQAADSDVGDIIGDATLNSPLRGLCYAVFVDCLLGNFNRMPSMRFVLSKFPAFSFSGENKIQAYDYNGIHGIWYILAEMVGLPESWLSSADFESVALVISQEYRGLSILFADQASALSYIEAINNHLFSVLRFGSDAAFHPKLIRDDYDAGSLETIDEDSLLDEPQFDRGSWIETINEVKVQFSEITNVTRPRGVELVAYSYLSHSRNYFVVTEDGEEWLQGVPDTDDASDEWQYNYGPEAIAGQAIAYSPLLKRWVMTFQSNFVLTSEDGKYWSKHSVISGDWEDVCWIENELGSGGYFVAVNRTYQATYQVMRSTDGITWEYYQDPDGAGSNGQWMGICAAGQRLVAVSIEDNAKKAMYSTNYGKTWTFASADSGLYRFTKVAYGGGLLIAASLGNHIGYSADAGLHWHKTNLPGGAYPSSLDVMFDEPSGLFWIGNTSGNAGNPLFWTTINGTTLTPVFPTGDGPANNVGYRLGYSPTDDDIIFVAKGHSLYKYSISENTIEEWLEGSGPGYEGQDISESTDFTVIHGRY